MPSRGAGPTSGSPKQPRSAAAWTETGCGIVAEGVETTAELAVLRKLGFNNVQGYLIGRPMPLDQAAALCAPQ